MTKVTAILLAGGSGTRMGGIQPKQFLTLANKPILLHSFEVLTALPEIEEIVVVCDPDYRHYLPSDTLFAMPGRRRQDSVYNGFQCVSHDSEIIVIHDAARPMISAAMVLRGLAGAKEYGAAVTAMPVKATIKQGQPDGFVDKTLDRTSLWEIQTPQVIRASLLRRAFEHALKHNLDVTDDVSLVEAIGHPVKLVEGSYHNLKITTPEDLVIAESILSMECGDSSPLC